MLTPHVLQGRLILPDRPLETGQVVLENGVIAEIVTGESRYTPTADYGDAYIAPGFIDLHVHGIGGADIMDASDEALQRMTARFAAHGVTGFLASTVTGSLGHLRRVIVQVRDFMARQYDGARILGIHLEGPWLSPQYKGMQAVEHMLTPDPAILQELLELGAGKITRVSLAPEFPGADELIRLLRRQGVFASIAHTAATYEEVLRAVDCGATQVTHCFNAMTPLHHRKPGVVGAALLIDDLFTELIADGIHIHPAVMQLLIRVKGTERVMLVTDAMRAAELPDGTYAFGGHDVTVRNGEARLADGTLASSTLTMDGAVRILVQRCGIPPSVAIAMASATPAAAMGLGAVKGKLRAGYDADLAVLDADLRPVATWIAGEVAS